jgi:hypothetical protein
VGDVIEGSCAAYTNVTRSRLAALSDERRNGAVAI